MTASRFASLSLLALLAAAGCGESRGTNPTTASVTIPGPNGDANGAVTVDAALCGRCHGDVARVPTATDSAGIQFAPPKDVAGATTGAKVGDHQGHLKAGPLRGAGVPCAACHAIPQGAMQHVPGVQFRGLAATSWTGTISPTPSYDADTGTCANTYCHGNFPGGKAASITWTSTAALGCSTCHGFPPAAPHPANATCESCHQGYTGGGQVNLTDHINGRVDGGCTGCHGDATRANGGIAGVSYDANQAAAPPVDTSGASTGILVGAHLAHVNPTPSAAGGAQPAGGVFKPIACTECHPDNTTGTHPGGGLQVTFANATTADLSPITSPSETPSSGGTAATCSTYCHNGAPDASATRTSWSGAPATCASCHGFPPASHAASLTTAAQCSPCHSGTVKADGTIDIAGGLHIDGTVQATGCTGCHGTDGRPNGDMVGFTYDPNQAAAPPVDTSGASTGILVGAHLSHVNPSLASGVYKPIACTECHPDNTTGTHPGGGLQLTFANATAADLALFVPVPTSSSGGTAATCTTYCHNGPNAAGFGGTATAWSWNAGPATCASCHGDPPATAGHVGLNASTNCGGCHPGYTATTVDLPTHINGQLDGGESVGGQACGGCHSTIFNAMNGTVAKTSRHTLGAVAGTNDSPTDSGVTWGSPLSGNAAASRSCVNMCHGDHPHDLTNPVVATHEYNAYLESTNSTTRGGATRTSATRAKTDFVIGEANGGLCTSCHRNPITAGGPTVPVATFGASAHDFTAASGYTWQYLLHSGSFDRNCTKCHASSAEGTRPQAAASSSGANSVHYGANPSLLAGTVAPIAAGNVCYNCHGSTASPAAGAQGNRSGKDLQTPFAKASTHNPAGSCLDCHAPHAAGSTLHSVGTNAIVATSPLNGASGVSYTPPAGNWPATVTGLAATATASREYEVCFKCHTSSPPAGLTNVAQEFSTNNHSVHPVVGPNTFWPLNQPATRLGGQWSAGVGKTMYCADCHGSDTTAGAQGPHGSAAAFILKGNGTARTYWPTDASGNYYQLGGTVTGLFCLNCHPNLNSTTSPNSNTLHRNGNHRNQGFACIDCHLRVPHGGKVPRLLITNTGDMASGAANPSPLKDPNAWKTTGRTPAYPGDTPPAAWARPTTTTNDMGTSNCTACSQHTCSSGTCEAW